MDFGELQTNIYDEKYYPLINGTLFSKQSSEVLYQQYFPELLAAEDHLFIIIGSDSGLLYRFLKSHKLPEHSRYLIIELEQVIEHLQIEDQENSFQDGSGISQIVVVNDKFDLNLIAVWFMNYLIRRKVSLIRSFAAQDAKAGSEYSALRKHFEQAYEQIIRQELISLNAKPFTDAQLSNFADNLKPMSEMRNRLEGASALILGGGPTLDSAIDWIKDNQNYLVIFAAARIARRLIKEGITPDIFVSVDPHDVSFDNSKGIFSFSDSSLLVNSHHINPKILGQWPGVSAYLGSSTPWKGDESENIGAPGPTVINTAVHLAFELGCTTFLFSGVDFCFMGSQAHESGSDEAKAGGKFVFNEVRTVLNNAEEMAQTEPTFAQARDIMELQVRQYQSSRPACQFFSLGLHSAKIENVQYISANELTLEGQSIQFEIDSMIEALKLSKDQKLKKVFERKLQLQKQIKRFHRIKSEAAKALGLIPNMYRVSGEEDSKSVKKFLKLKRSIEKLIADDGDMLFHYENKDFSANFKSITDESSMTSHEVKEQLNTFFKGVLSSSGAFHRTLLTALERVDLRINELQGRHLTTCIAQWEKLEQPGRAVLWSLWNSGKSLECIQPLIEQFRYEVNRSETDLTSQLKKKSHNLPRLFNRVLKALEEHDKKEIMEIIDYIKSLPNQDGTVDLIYFSKGALSELNEELAQAKAYYLKISFSSIRHQALKRAMNISMTLQDNETSLKLLEELCRYSLDYMLPYSRLLDLLGQKEFAVEVLTMYLQQKPENDPVRVQLAQKLIELGKNAEARSLLQEILSKNPDHQTVRQLLERI